MRTSTKLTSLFVAALVSSLAACPGRLVDPERFKLAASNGGDAGPCPDVPTTIFGPVCATSGCHSTVGPAQGLDLQSPNIFARLAGKMAVGGPGVILDPQGDPQKSDLYLKLTSTPPFGAQMPMIGAKLDAHSLSCVGSWIEAQAAAVADAGMPDGGVDSAPSTNVDATIGDAADAGAKGVNMYVATGYQNRRIVSLDGVTWINDVSDPPNANDDIGTGAAIGLGTIVVAGHTGIYTSTDGQSWTKLPPPIPQAWPGLGGAAATFANGRFVIVSSNDSWTSTDGITFTDNAPDGSIGATHWNGLTFGNGHYFAVGDSNGPGDRKVSEDGINWHDYVQDTPSWTGLAYGAGVFVAVGISGRRAWTTDGVTLNDVSDPTLGDANGVAFGGGMFIVAGTMATATSPDGKTWTTAPSFGASEMSYGGGLFATTTWMSNILTSSDGATWKDVFTGDAGSPALSRVVWGTVGGP